jgi:hypothetical protein
MSHYTNPRRYWFTERNKLGFVEGGSSTSIDGVTSNLVSISEAKSCTIKGISLPNTFPVGNDIYYIASYTDPEAGPLGEIPLQFHEALAYKTIAMGYQDPRNLNIELAQYFNNEYDKVCKRAKKYARSNFQSTGQIVPQEF